jgi:hypothetical protein
VHGRAHHRARGRAALPGDFAVTVRVRSEQTNGVMAAIEQTLQPKAFIPPHVHLNDV